MSNERFTAMEIDTLGEILNISLGASATAVSNMLGKRVEITTPQVQVEEKKDFQYANLEPAIGVSIDYIQGLDGRNVMIFKRKDIKAIVEILMGTEMTDEEFVLDELTISAVCEVMNQMMGASATALSDFFNKVIDISTPQSFEIMDKDSLKENYLTEEDTIVTVGFDFMIEEKINTRFLSILTVELAKELISSFDLGMAEASVSSEMDKVMIVDKSDLPAVEQPMQQVAQENQAAEVTSEPQAAQMMYQQPATQDHVQDQVMYQQSVSQGYQQPAQPMYQQSIAPGYVQGTQMMYQQPMPQGYQQVGSTPKIVSAQPIQQLQFEQIHTGHAGEQAENMQLIMNVPLELSVELGRASMSVKDILEFVQGSLIVLNKMVGEPADLFVNGQLIAKGDVVVVDDSFGIRITEIIKRSIL